MRISNQKETGVEQFSSQLSLAFLRTPTFFTFFQHTDALFKQIINSTKISTMWEGNSSFFYCSHTNAAEDSDAVESFRLLKNITLIRWIWQGCLCSRSRLRVEIAHFVRRVPPFFWTERHVSIYKSEKKIRRKINTTNNPITTHNFRNTFRVSLHQAITSQHWGE